MKKFSYVLATGVLLYGNSNFWVHTRLHLLVHTVLSGLAGKDRTGSKIFDVCYVLMEVTRKGILDLSVIRI